MTASKNASGSTASKNASGPTASKNGSTQSSSTGNGRLASESPSSASKNASGSNASLGSGKNSSNSLPQPPKNLELFSSSRNDTFSGGPGVDSVTFLGPVSNYSISGIYRGKNGGLTGYTVTDEWGNDGVDTVDLNVEFLKFADGTTLKSGDTSILRSALPKYNLVTGSKNADRLFGTSGNDHIQGLAGNDVIFASAGNDLINGGPGLDTLVFSGASNGVLITSDFSPVRSAEGFTHKLTWGSGTVELASIERLRFADKSFALDITGKDEGAAMVARLIIAAFGVKELSSLLGTGLAIHDSGQSKQELLKLLTNSDLLTQKAGRPNTPEDFVQVIFQNVVGQMPNSFQTSVYSGLANTNGRDFLLSLAADHELTNDILQSQILALGLPFTETL